MLTLVFESPTIILTTNTIFCAITRIELPPLRFGTDAVPP
jgi:hypothetical protein